MNYTGMLARAEKRGFDRGIRMAKATIVDYPNYDGDKEITGEIEKLIQRSVKSATNNEDTETRKV